MGLLRLWGSGDLKKKTAEIVTIIHIYICTEFQQYDNKFWLGTYKAVSSFNFLDQGPTSGLRFHMGIAFVSVTSKQWHFL